ncbi:MAG: alpha/beta hydrolase [Actinomycetota bacterium]|nr:alpha/beta hydrolase [Actinomycetota bacterium]
MKVHLPLGLVRVADRLTLRQALRLPIERQRKALEQLAALSPVPRGVSVTQLSLGGVPCERIVHPGATRGTLVYLHGGGYAAGSPRTHRGLAARLALAAGTEAIVPDYRLAPEHPCPAAIDDALACIRALPAAGVASDRVVVAGDSAGGGLALALAGALRDSDEKLPVGLGLISPWVDLTISGESTRRQDGVDAVLSRDFLLAASSRYTGAVEPRDPRASPLHGDLSGLPAVLIQTGAEELFLSENRDLAARIRDAWGEVSYQELDRCWHVVQVHAGTLREADLAVAAMGAWIADRLTPG